MRSISRYLFLIVISCGCGDQKAREYLIELKEKLDVIETPIVFNSNDTTNFKLIHFPNNGMLTKLQRENFFLPIGRLASNDEILVIIGGIPSDSGAPILITIDRKGNEIDRLILYPSAGFDIGYHCSNYVKINSDNSILIIDSLLTRKVNKDKTEEVEGTDSLVVTRSRFRLTPEGRIERVE